ncbi:hypothetical protein ACQUEF_13490 [Vagococcus fluvialis]|uniref:hypothetical protein n=1 Tax=Vagococcus fluvialis TaxID=2738 RepID=UPI003D0E5D73
MNNNEERIQKIREELSIKGIVNVKKGKKESKSSSTRFETKSFVIDYYLHESYKLGEEFLMQEMSKTLREEGWKTSCISGQLYSKKNAGLLTSRKPTEKEAEILGRNVAIWSLTELFFEKISDEIAEYKQLEGSKAIDEEILDTATETD